MEGLVVVELLVGCCGCRCHCRRRAVHLLGEVGVLEGRGKDGGGICWRRSPRGWFGWSDVSTEGSRVRSVGCVGVCQW